MPLLASSPLPCGERWTRSCVMVSTVRPRVTGTLDSVRHCSLASGGMSHLVRACRAGCRDSHTPSATASVVCPSQPPSRFRFSRATAVSGPRGPSRFGLRLRATACRRSDQETGPPSGFLHPRMGSTFSRRCHFEEVSPLQPTRGSSGRLAPSRGAAWQGLVAYIVSSITEVMAFTMSWIQDPSTRPRRAC